MVIMRNDSTIFSYIDRFCSLVCAVKLLCIICSVGHSVLLNVWGWMGSYIIFITGVVGNAEPVIFPQVPYSDIHKFSTHVINYIPECPC